MPWRSVVTSLLGALVLALLAFTTACTSTSSQLEARARAHAAARLAAAKGDLVVTERSDLSTDRHAVMRVTAPDGRALTVVVPRGGAEAFDASAPDAFAQLARAENLAERYAALGAVRVAGWYGALGNGPCGELMAHEKKSVQVEERPDARLLTYRFAAGDKVQLCHVELGLDGEVRRAEADIAPIAKR
jgi:hypothetical protein